MGAKASHSQGLATSSVSFVRPNFSLSSIKQHSSLGNLFSLPDLVEFNALDNPSHLFCVQYSRDPHSTPRAVSSADLYNAVLRCSAWLSVGGLVQLSGLVDGEITKAQPVAILMASDIGWFISFIALLRLGVPVLCLSTRLAPQAVVHLVRSTRTQAILVSPHLESLASESVSLLDVGDSAPAICLVPPYSEFLDPDSKLNPLNAPPQHLIDDKTDAVILHSSGTTGLPKPIFHSHAYLLGYAACHKLSPQDVESAINVSTLPLFHGFGLLAPCLSLSVGMPFALPSAGTIPTGLSTLQILKSSGATSLMTVPSILEELYLLKDSAGVDMLRKLRFVAVGGAPMKNSVAEPLVHAGVPILNHWGVTEIGAIAPIFVPRGDYDWHYLRVRDDIGLRFEPVEGDRDHCRLIGCPPGTDAEFVVQDLLVVNPMNPTNEFRIAGRADDLIVLATGEKVRPTLLEQLVSENPLVRGAVAFGDGKFQLGLMIEATPHFALDLSDEQAVTAYLDLVWPSVAEGNERTDKHARVAREMIIVTTPAVQALIRTPKGSIPRGPNVELLKDKVDELYSRADVAGATALPIDDPVLLRDAVRRLVLLSFSTPRSISDVDDFFEHGMDSLQATILRRHLNAAVTLSLPKPSSPLPSDIVYANSSVSMLVTALVEHCRDEKTAEFNGSDRLAHIRSVVEEYVGRISSLTEEVGAPPASSGTASSGTELRRAVVLLTGSTGSLGSAILDVLASSPMVQTIHALNRASSRSLQERQLDGLRKLGVDLGTKWGKIKLYEADLAAVHFGLEEATYSSFGEVTHVVHNAWPMDFNRSLTSFAPHLEATLNIIKLAVRNTHSQPVRVLFSSSIAVVGRSPLVADQYGVEEAVLRDPSAIDHFGYAEAKWVCERMFEEASQRFSHKLSASSVRIGQMTGPELTGAWNTAEHFPMIVKSCVATGNVPNLEGSASWIPVNRAAKVMSELLLEPLSSSASPIFHLENPVRQPWSDILSSIASSIGVSADSTKRPTFDEWLQLVKTNTDSDHNPCAKIIPFLEQEFIRMATGQVVLDTIRARSISPTLASSQALSKEQLLQFVGYWKAEGYL